MGWWVDFGFLRKGESCAVCCNRGSQKVFLILWLIIDDQKEHVNSVRLWSNGEVGVSQKSSRPDSVGSDWSSEMKENQGRCLETVLGSDPPLGRRVSGVDYNWSRNLLLHGLKNEPAKYGACKGVYVGKKHTWFRIHVKSVVIMFGLMGSLFLLDSLLFSIFDSMNLPGSSGLRSISDRKV